MSDAAEQIAERLVIAVLSAYDNVEYPDSPAVKALLDAGLKEAVEALEQGASVLSKSPTQPNPILRLRMVKQNCASALAALKGEKA